MWKQGKIITPVYLLATDWQGKRLSAFAPSYRKLLQSGELNQRVQEAYRRLECCEICPRVCRKNRLAGELGVCRNAALALVSSYGPHLGEENPLRGWRGSGTIFFSGCNLRCQYCQNYEISQRVSGHEVEPQELAAIMLELQSYGCHNINFVSPTHVVPQILSGVAIAAQAGLRLPLVYNTGGFDSLESLALLDGVVDIYMPDMKYASAQIAKYYSRIRDYPSVNQAAVHEMHRQVGDLIMDERGIAQRGLLVRHLVLPYNLAGSEEILRFLAEEISKNTYLNLMDQYRPAYHAMRYPKLKRRITSQEYQHVRQLAAEFGLLRLDH
jgi:putative pyruvate formate lyase activating enzyme